MKSAGGLVSEASASLDIGMLSYAGQGGKAHPLPKVFVADGTRAWSQVYIVACYMNEHLSKCDQLEGVDLKQQQLIRFELAKERLCARNREA